MKWLKPKINFYRGIVEKCPPYRIKRWCCDLLKERTSDHIPLKKKLLGVRAEESSKRARRHQISTFKGAVSILPIFYFLEWEVWEYIHENNIPYCHLYDEGFDRLGCCVCPLICGDRANGKYNAKLQLHMEYFPKHYHAFEIAMKKFYKKKQDTMTIPFNEFLDNWYRGK